MAGWSLDNDLHQSFPFTAIFGTPTDPKTFQLPIQLVRSRTIAILILNTGEVLSGLASKVSSTEEIRVLCKCGGNDLTVTSVSSPSEFAYLASSFGSLLTYCSAFPLGRKQPT